MKIYTRKGDTGTTSLQSGVRVSKSDPRIAACGCLDELNAHIGLLLSLPGIPDEPHLSLRMCQSDLFNIGAWVSSSHNLSTSNTHYLEKIEATRLEKNIDDMELLVELAVDLPCVTFLHSHSHILPFSRAGRERN